jgi:serine/threonine-protein kinase
LENPAGAVFCAKCATKLGTGAQFSVTRTLETTPEELGKGKLFAGRFEMIEELGAGGMGIVYRAYDKKVGEEIALKILHPEIALDETTVDRFRNEIKLARKISHRNVCRMHELHKEGKTLFITMECVPGQDLKGLIKETGALSTGKAISIAKQVAEGMCEAHNLGVIHRDLKPQNIMVEKFGGPHPDRGRLADFRAGGPPGATDHPNIQRKAFRLEEVCCSRPRSRRLGPCCVYCSPHSAQKAAGLARLGQVTHRRALFREHLRRPGARGLENRPV